MAAPSRRQRIGAVLDILAPDLPDFEHQDIVDHALDSPGLIRASDQSAAWAALVAHARHRHTDYDQLIRDGWDKDAARFFVLDQINHALNLWGCRRKLDPGQKITES